MKEINILMWGIGGDSKRFSWRRQLPKYCPRFPVFIFAVNVKSENLTLSFKNV